jgi:hypothetical protein
MFLRVISLLLLLLTAPFAYAQNDVTQWLQRMGCDELLARYLENELDNGDRKAKIRAAKQLADVYAIMLARSDQKGNKETLERAISLFDRIPEAGTTDLKLQLYRATYIAAEQILERYRLRISDAEEAEIAVNHLREVTEDLQSLRGSLLKQLKSSRTQNEKKQQQLGLITSYLAWARYYLAWHEQDQSEATQSAQLFAEILLGDSPNLQTVSLDLKTHETGARAILGIALCKSILKDPNGPDRWFDELEDQSTWSSVRVLVPLWKFFLHVDNKEWNLVLEDLQSPNGVDQTLMYRVAAVHSLEDYSNPVAKNVAKISLTGLIHGDQLGIVSDIIKMYGADAMQKDGFIALYIMGDIAYRELTETYTSDEPAKIQGTKDAFVEIARTFDNAILATDASTFKSLIDDCQFMKGLCLFYAGQFDNSSIAFRKAAEGNNKEQAIWMAIVSLNYIDPLSAAQLETKEELTGLYLVNWPNSEHATQLTIHQSGTESESPQNIENLLAIPHSDPRYQDAQRQASRSLYKAWQQTTEVDYSSIGNKYVSVAMPLMVSDSTLKDDLKSTEVASVRAMRILEVALHPEVMRLVAAKRAIELLDEIGERNTYSIDTLRHEITFRHIMLLLHQQEHDTAANLLVDMIENAPQEKWATIAATSLWNHWASLETEIEDELMYMVGKQILTNLTEYQYANREYLHIATQTTEAAFELYLMTNTIEIGDDALRISRTLVSQKPLIVQILLLNAIIEMELGDQEVALTRWKTIASGSTKGSLQWLQARYNIILMLSNSSEESALAVLNQHHALYPNYGKDPYGSKLKELHNELMEGNNES